MRVQESRIPKDHVLVVRNGRLVPMPAVGNRLVHSTHCAGVATGELGNALATPFMMLGDILKSAASSIAGSQYGQSTKYGWDKAENRKAEWAMGRQLSKVDPQARRIALIETIEGPQKGNWALIVSRMSDSEVTRELARRSTPFSYIDEQDTYNGQEMDYSEPQTQPEPRQERTRETRTSPFEGIAPSMPSYAQ
jgi:hypothetical protein